MNQKNLCYTLSLSPLPPPPSPHPQRRWLCMWCFLLVIMQRTNSIKYLFSRFILCYIMRDRLAEIFRVQLTLQCWIFKISTANPRLTTRYCFQAASRKSHCQPRAKQILQQEYYFTSKKVSNSEVHESRLWDVIYIWYERAPRAHTTNFSSSTS